MFKIVDEVTVDRDYPITKVGDIGTITDITRDNYTVVFHTIAREDFIGYTFHFAAHSLVHIKDCPPFKTAVERKIASMYARQYRKTGHACFL